MSNNSNNSNGANSGLEKPPINQIYLLNNQIILSRDKDNKVRANRARTARVVSRDQGQNGQD